MGSPVYTSLPGFIERPGHAGRSLVLWLCRRHNVVQLVGYEAGNLALLAQHGLAPGHAGAFEALAAASFMLGSLGICFFDPARRPALLLLGGLWLTLGGLMLVLAGYPFTGGAVMLASLETARGGLAALQEAAGRGPLAGAATLLMAPYCRLARLVMQGVPTVGDFVQNRPFLTSTMIKLPLRLEFILRNLAAGDAVGVLIGLSWMLLGDGALALNDQGLKERLERAAGAERRPAPR